MKVPRVLAAVPRIASWPFRKLRTVALVVANPFDRLHRRLTGREKLPPLRLRRLLGPVSAYERAPGEIAAIVAMRKLVTPGARVLDIGCGSGMMAFELARFLGPQGRYTGFDVHAPSLRWARRQFRRDPRFTFELARLRSPYSERYKESATTYRFPAATHTVDFALALALFTHLPEEEALHYMAEICRVLTREGRALLTAFLPESETDVALPGSRYRFPSGGPDIWRMARAKPTDPIAYRRDHFLSMLDAAGLEVLELADGYWNARGASPTAQDALIVRRRPPTIEAHDLLGR